MRNAQEKSKITALAALLVFCLFAVCILGVLLAGAKSYRQMTQKSQQVYDDRTVVGYLSMRVRQADRCDGIRLEDFAGSPALVIRETVEERVYLTRIYCFDGYIRELFCQEGGNLSGEAGEKILPAQAVSFELDGSILTVTLTHADGSQEQMILLLRSEGGII